MKQWLKKIRGRSGSAFKRMRKYAGLYDRLGGDTFGGVGIVGLIISLTAFCLLTFGFSLIEYKFLQLSNPEKIRLLGGAVASGLVLVGLGLNAKRIQQQGKQLEAQERRIQQYEKQLETQEKGLYAERLKSAITLLSDRSVSVQLGAISLLHTLAQEVPGTEEEKKKKRKEIQEVLCSFVRTETSTQLYKIRYERKPSDIVRKILNIMIHRKDFRGPYFILHLKPCIKEDIKTETPPPLFNAAEIDLSSAYLRGADLSGAYMQGANLIKADLQRADLREACLQRTNLHEADLQGAFLIKADLHEAVIQKTHLQRANLREACLQRANLNEADLQNTDLREANLESATLKAANLQGAKLQNAGLSSAAYLQGADLRGAELENARLSETRLHFAMIDSGQKEWIKKACGDVCYGVEEVIWANEDGTYDWKSLNVSEGENVVIFGWYGAAYTLEEFKSFGLFPRGDWKEHKSVSESDLISELEEQRKDLRYPEEIRDIIDCVVERLRQEELF